MRLNLHKIKTWVLAMIGTLTLSFASLSGVVSAAGDGITMSPPNEVIVLNAGEKFTGTFTISNASGNKSDFRYEVIVQPFFVDENYNIYYEENEGLNQMVNWITVDKASGILPVNGSEKINFTIDVPKDAPAGGQYAAITVKSVSDENSEDANSEVGVNMEQNIAMAHIIYAEVAGTTRHSGEVISTSLQSFLIDGNIEASSTIKNTGNTHGKATYKLQIFPLFSGEEVYTNEENPETQLILPGRTLTNISSWDKTPAIGIFNVKYTVEFEGVTTEISKLVIKCPLWLLFIIIFVIIALIIWIVMRVRTHKKESRETAA